MSHRTMWGNYRQFVTSSASSDTSDDDFVPPRWSAGRRTSFRNPVNRRPSLFLPFGFRHEHQTDLGSRMPSNIFGRADVETSSGLVSRPANYYEGPHSQRYHRPTPAFMNAFSSSISIPPVSRSSVLRTAFSKPFRAGPGEQLWFGGRSFHPLAKFDDAPQASPAKPGAKGFSRCQDRATAAQFLQNVILSRKSRREIERQEQPSPNDIFNRFWVETDVSENANIDEREQASPSTSNSTQTILTTTNQQQRDLNIINDPRPRSFLAWNNETTLSNSGFSSVWTSLNEVPSNQTITTGSTSMSTSTSTGIREISTQTQAPSTSRRHSQSFARRQRSLSLEENESSGSDDFDGPWNPEESARLFRLDVSPVPVAIQRRSDAPRSFTTIYHRMFSETSNANDIDIDTDSNSSDPSNLPVLLSSDSEDNFGERMYPVHLVDETPSPLLVTELSGFDHDAGDVSSEYYFGGDDHDHDAPSSSMWSPEDPTQFSPTFGTSLLTTFIQEMSGGMIANSNSTNSSGSGQ